MNDLCFVILKYGGVYLGINPEYKESAYHPYIGSNYDYMTSCESIEWTLSHGISNNAIEEYIKTVVAYEINHNNKNYDKYEFSKRVLELDHISNESIEFIDDIYNKFINNELDFEEYYIKSINHDYMNELLDKAGDILNNRILRVCRGGKYYQEHEDAIYFRISSHDYDWKGDIFAFLWDEYKDISKMPKRIVICHDEDSNPPDITLFDSTAEDLFEHSDDKLFEELIIKCNKYRKESMNSTRRFLSIKNILNKVNDLKFV